MFINWRCLECSWTSLSFAIHIKAKLLYFCHCSVDAIVEFHAMGEDMFNDFLIGK